MNQPLDALRHGAAAALLTLLTAAPAQATGLQSEAFIDVIQQTCGLNCAADVQHAYRQQRWMSRDGVLEPGDGMMASSPNGNWSQLATAFASLPTGMLRVQNSGAVASGVSNQTGTVRASIADTYFVSGVFDPAARSRLSVDVTGLLSASGSASNYVASVTLQLLAPGSIDAFSRGDFGAVQALASRSVAWGGADWGVPSTLQPPQTVELLFVAPATPFEWMLSFFGTYTHNSLTGPSGVTMELGHTLEMHFDAPLGASALSASGYVAPTSGWTDPLSPVPEPAAWRLALAGLALLAVARLRGRLAHLRWGLLLAALGGTAGAAPVVMNLGARVAQADFNGGPDLLGGFSVGDRIQLTWTLDTAAWLDEEPDARFGSFCGQDMGPIQLTAPSLTARLDNDLARDCVRQNSAAAGSGSTVIFSPQAFALRPGLGLAAFELTFEAGPVGPALFDDPNLPLADLASLPARAAAISLSGFLSGRAASGVNGFTFLQFDDLSVRFDETPPVLAVPEPGSLALVAAALCAGSLRTRSKVCKRSLT
jgi:hypothetical protein